MDKLAQLLNIIDVYSSQAHYCYRMAKFAQDGDNYNRLLELAKQIKDPGLASELVLLAQLYKKAIEIKGGYNSIKRSINNIINMYLEDEDDPQQEEIENVLNEVVTDLRKRAGGGVELAKPDSPEALKALKALKDEFNIDHLDQEVSDLSNYEESAAGVFDPFGGVNPEDAGKGFGRGFSYVGQRAPKDWANFYYNEAQRYADLLPSVFNSNSKNKISRLLEVLKDLRTGSIKEQILAEEYASNNSEETLAELNALREENKKLKLERRALRIKIRDEELSHSARGLEAELKGTSNPRDRERLEQELELQKLLASKDKNKTEEINWRKLLIRSMSNGNWPSPETMASFKSRIQEAAGKKKSAAEVEKEKADKLKKHKESGSLLGKVIFYGQNINTQRRELKRKIYPAIKTKVYDALLREEATFFKPYIDAINAAKDANDTARVATLVKNLNAAISSKADSHPAVISYNEKAKELQTYENALNNLVKSEAQVDQEVLNQFAEEGKRLITLIQTEPIFRPIIKNLTEIVALLLKGEIR